MLEELLNTLSLQKLNLKKLKSLARAKQYALIKINREKLEKCVQREERGIINVKKLERTRLAFIEKMSNELELNLKSPKLLDFAEALGNRISVEEKKELIRYRNEIKKITEEITELNYGNMTLLEHSQSFLSEMITILLENKKKSILDRRV